MKELVAKIAKDLSLKEQSALKAVHLLFEEDCSIPFVARYRKEQTDSMNEVDLRKLRDAYSYAKELEALKTRYIKVITEHSKSKPQVAKELPSLLKKIEECTAKQALEDIYLPFKPKRITKAQKAKEKGLEPLVDAILNSANKENEEASLSSLVESFRENLKEPHKGLSEEEILEGASFILAERLYENSDIKRMIRELTRDTGYLEASAKLSEEDLKNQKERSLYEKYENYFSYKEPLTKAACHRVMALRRGEADKVLRVKIEVDKAEAETLIYNELAEGKSYSSDIEAWLKACVKNSYARQLSPSIETELRLELKKAAEGDAINVFSKNLEKLLMLPIIPDKVVMGIDPGIRTGSKIAVISKTAKLLAYTTVYPDLKSYSSERTEEAMAAVKALIEKYDVSYISIGNGTGGRDIEAHVRKLLQELGLNKAIRSVLVNESGASVYSVEPIAIEEFPDLDPTIRSAVSIARRLQDPLAELVKIEPRSIGIGQYQHDCNALKLNESLKDVVESCVNRVGVNINTASHKLLSYVSGIGASLGKKIVEHRDNSGPFMSRQDFLEVSGFGEKTFLQSAGFLRVPESNNVLDKTSVHPERYELLEKIAKDNELELSDLINKEKTSSLNWESYEAEGIGLPTLLDIKKELLSPGRDPRKNGSKISYSKSLLSLDELKLDMKIKGTVSNVTNFGAFVDIGLHQDGLVHISELSDEFVKDPSLVVSVGDVLNVRVIGVDLKRKRISLTCKNYDKSAMENKAPAKDLAEEDEHKEQILPPRNSKTKFSYNNGNGNGNGNSNKRINGNTSRNGKGPAYPKTSNGNGPAYAKTSNGNSQTNTNRERPKPRAKKIAYKKTPYEPQKQHSMGDLMSKFNNK